MRLAEIATTKLAGMAAPFNPRQMSDHDMASLRRSLRQFGAVEPVVVNRRSGRLVGGHQRVKAAEAEGIRTLPVVYVDLDDAGEKQLNLALNRIQGDWDMKLLEDILRDLQGGGASLELAGFTDGELLKLLGEPVTADGLTDPDAIPAPPDKPRTKRGEVIELGSHRLLCGDSGNPDDLAKLLAGDVVHLVNTDPPYNVRVEPRSNNAIAANLAKGKRGSVKGNVPRAQLDKMHHQGLDLARHPGKSKPTGKMRAKDRPLENDFVTDEAFARMLGAWFGNLSRALAPGRSFYIWGGYSNIRNYPKALDDAGLFFSQTIIWHKQWPVLTRKDYMGDHEWCFYGWKEGAAHYFDPDITNATDVWSVKKVSPPSMVHLTEKPVELAERAMIHSSRRGEAVLDLFGGSGSTLIAAERTGRVARLIELDPAYCDVIVTRWEAHTGGKAKRGR